MPTPSAQEKLWFMLSHIPRAEFAPELLDEEQHDPRELTQSLDHVAAVNRWLGGVRSLLLHVTRFLESDARVLDVGTGSADLPRRIAKWCRKHHRRVTITATDLHPQMLAIAAAKCVDYPEIIVEGADALSLPYPDKSFDVATLSLTLHHFDGPAQVQVLRELGRVTRRVVIVNELQRSRINYIGAKILAATLWRFNRLTRHDGPLSVLRAFTPNELLALCEKAGMRGTVHTHYFQRVVLVAIPQESR